MKTTRPTVPYSLLNSLTLPALAAKDCFTRLNRFKIRLPVFQNTASFANKTNAMCRLDMLEADGGARL